MNDWRNDPALQERLSAIECAASDVMGPAKIACAASTTPIEFLMAAALEVVIRNGTGRLNVLPIYAGIRYETMRLPDDTPRPLAWSVMPQVKVDAYTADFILRHEAERWKGEGTKIVLVAIECDGHDHHDLTKEQAERDRRRDRYFQERGLRVARFTGREIWRDALSCARQAMTLAELAWQEGEYP